MSEIKKPDITKVLKGASKKKLKKTVVKETSSVSSHTKLMGSIKKRDSTLIDASSHLKSAEDATKRATIAAYKAAKSDRKSRD
mmetsp:Transcript_15843/g.19052  ORF Transcript_15843/g.19052 Transcript_15843/m.19052 type:complete len:83 (-) Transcript_15843:215-463(-)